MKKMQRILSLLLTAGMLFGLFAGLGGAALAEEGADVTLSFYGLEKAPITGAAGAQVTLPSLADGDDPTPDGYTFLGWTDAFVNQTTDAPDYYPEGDKYTLPTEDTTLYALYSFVDGRGTPSIDRYEKVTSMDELKDGSYLIGVEYDGAFLVFDGSSDNPNASGNYKTLNVSSTDTIPADSASDTCAVSLTKLSDSDKYSFKMKNGSGKYFGSKGDTGMSTRGTEPYPLCIEFDGSSISVYYDGDKDLYLGYYNTSSTQKFGFYNNTSTVYADLYRRIDGIDGTLYYTGTATVCTHENIDCVDPSCTVDGYTLCQDCGYKWTDDGQAATGHNYEVSEIIAPTVFEGGYTVYVCSNCGDSYNGDEVEPLGEDHDITYIVLGETWRTDTVNSYEGTDLPEPNVVPDGYEFAGWSTFEYKDETDAATLIEEDPETGKFHPAYDYTLHAVYKRGEYAAGSGDFVKITEMPADGLDGQFLVVYEDGNIAFNSAFATTATNLAKPGNYLPVTITNNTIAATTELNAASVLIGKIDKASTYYMQINSGLKIGSSGSSTVNGINGDKNKTYQNDISFNTNGTAVIANAAATNTGANIYNFTYNDSSVDRFAFCKPTTKTVHEVCLYQKQEGTTTWCYTTAPATAGCEHEVYTSKETAPTCTEAGYTEYTCSNCGYKWTEEGEAALGHSYDDGVVTAPTPTAVGYTTYTCTVCGDTYQDNFIGFDFEITYNVLGTDREPVTVNNKDGADFPTDVPEITGYKFAGWAEEEIPEEINSATVKTGHYIPTEDATYYAVYTRKEANDGDGNYYKVTSLPLVENGNYLIVDETMGYAFKAAEEDNEDYDLTKANNYITVSVSNGVIAESSEADIASIVINPATENPANYSMTGSETGKYIGTTGSSTGIMENTKNEYPVTITFYGGNAVICNASGNTIYQLAYNTQSTSDKFGFFSPTSKTANPVALYCKNGSGFTTYYTTQPEIDCAHEHTKDFAQVDASCTEPGYTAGVYCNDCQTWISGHEIIEKLPHSYSEDERSDATCTQDGFITYICEYCDDTYDEILPATGHTYDENGACTECGDKLVKIESAALRLDEDIDVIYTAKVPDGATATMTFTMNGKSVTVEDDGSHEFAFEGVNPQCMGDNIEATLTVTVGDKTYTDTKAEYSVKTYCANQLRLLDLPTVLRTILSDVLAYGAAAQTYMDYKTDSLVTKGVKGLSCSKFSELSGLAPVLSGDAEGPAWVGAGLTLTDDVAMTFRFYAESVEGLIVTVKINNRTEEFNEFTPVVGKENVYEISFKGIKATEFGDAVTASFSAGGNTVSYSVNTYICAKQNDSDANLAALVKALYNYGASAVAFSTVPQLGN